jgi:hypothetical protein
MRRAITALTIVTGLALAAGADWAVPPQLGGRFAKYSAALSNSDLAVNPVQRFFLSLILAQAEPCEDSRTM